LIGSLFFFTNGKLFTKDCWALAGETLGGSLVCTLVS